MPDMTATQRLANHMLPDGLAAYVLDRRRKGHSWRRIALDLRDDLGIDVTHETVRSWYFAEDAALDDEAGAA